MFDTMSWIYSLWVCSLFATGSVATTASLVHKPQSSVSRAGNFKILEISRPNQVVRVGDTLTLTCRTNVAWGMCSWKMTQEEDWCDRLRDSSKYMTACEKNPRIRYEKLKTDETTNSNYDCAITVVDVSLTDSGNWTCQVKDDVRGKNFLEENFSVAVASPFSVKITEDSLSQNVLDFSNKNSSVTIVCVANGTGDVVPTLQWMIESRRIRSDKLRTWSEKSSGGYELVYQALSINSEYLSEFLRLENLTIESAVNIRCNSNQFLPNGSVVYQSSVVTSLKIIFSAESSKLSDQSDEESMNVTGTVIVGIIALILLITIFFICWAHKKNKFCFETQDYRSQAINRADETTVVSETTQEEVRLIASHSDTHPSNSSAPITSESSVLFTITEEARQQSSLEVEHPNLNNATFDEIETIQHSSTQDSPHSGVSEDVSEQALGLPSPRTSSPLSVLKKRFSNKRSPGTKEEFVNQTCPSPSSAIEEASVALVEEPTAPVDEDVVVDDVENDPTAVETSIGVQEQSSPVQISPISSNDINFRLSVDIPTNSEVQNLSPRPLSAGFLSMASALPPASSLPPPPQQPAKQPIVVEADIEPVAEQLTPRSHSIPLGIQSFDADRLLELISAPPGNLDIDDRSLSGNFSSIGSGSSRGLSQTLTTPREEARRRKNDYVVVALPRSRTTSSSAQPVTSTPSTDVDAYDGHSPTERAPVSETAL